MILKILSMQNIVFLELNNEYLGITVESYINQLLNRKIVGLTSGVSATIVKILSSSESERDYLTIYVKYDSSGVSNINKRFIDGEIINEPLDFSSKNRSSLTDMHNIIKNLIYPEITLSKFNLNVEDYDFLRYWMSRLTFEDLGNKYITNDKFFNSYNKFFIHGIDTVLKKTDIRVYNKIGQAYGTSTDSAYIKNYKEDIEFFLTATIYTNNNEIINDDIYEYSDIAIPFLSKLSNILYKNLAD